MKILVVIPTYNERENIQLIIEEVIKQDNRIEVLVVDDSSPDGTGEIVREICKKDSKVHLLIKEKKEGLGKAYQYGFKWGIEHSYDIIVQMDADFSHNPEDIKIFLEKIEKENYDFVIGSRYINGVSVVNWPIKRLLLSYFANLYAKIFTGVCAKDLTGGFKAWKKEVLEKIPWEKITTGGYGFQIETSFYAKRHGYKFIEIPIIFIERRKGISKMSKRIIFEAFFLVLKLFLKRFLKFL